MITADMIPDEVGDVLAQIEFCSSYAAKSALAAALSAWPGKAHQKDAVVSHRFAPPAERIILPLSKEPRT